MGNIGQAEAGGVTISDASWRYYLTKFIQYTRQISPDRDMTLKNLSEAYAMVTQTGSGVLTSLLKAEDAFTKIGGGRREIQLETLIRVTAKSWQADWVESVTSASGEEVSAIRKRGIYTVLQGQPDAQQIKLKSAGDLYRFLSDPGHRAGEMNMKNIRAFAFALTIALALLGCTTTKDLERRPELVAVEAGNVGGDSASQAGAVEPTSQPNSKEALGQDATSIRAQGPMQVRQMPRCNRKPTLHHRGHLTSKLKGRCCNPACNGWDTTKPSSIANSIRSRCG